MILEIKHLGISKCNIENTNIDNTRDMTRNYAPGNPVFIETDM